MADKEMKKTTKNGFTLVEVMAAVAILSIGLVGSLTIINRNLKAISSEEKRMMAIGLAEDGLERARNVRDTDWLSGSAWGASFGFNATVTKAKLSFFCDGSLRTAEGKTETASWSSTIDQSGCNGNKCMIFEYDAGTQFACYSDDFGNNVGIYTRVNPRTEMRRLITAEKIGLDQIKINVVVRWTEGAIDKYLTTEETLYNWK